MYDKEKNKVATAEFNRAMGALKSSLSRLGNSDILGLAIGYFSQDEVQKILVEEGLSSACYFVGARIEEDFTPTGVPENTVAALKEILKIYILFNNKDVAYYSQYIVNEDISLHAIIATFLYETINTEILKIPYEQAPGQLEATLQAMDSLFGERDEGKQGD